MQRFSLWKHALTPPRRPPALLPRLRERALSVRRVLLRETLQPLLLLLLPPLLLLRMKAWLL